jgi:hypothetical protein
MQWSVTMYSDTLVTKPYTHLQSIAVGIDDRWQRTVADIDLENSAANIGMVHNSVTSQLTSALLACLLACLTLAFRLHGACKCHLCVDGQVLELDLHAGHLNAHPAVVGARMT